MLLKKIILRNKEKFGETIISWSNKQQIEVEVFDGKINLLDLVESMVILHEDHNISKENKDLRELLKKKNKPTHLVDINGTINASVTSLKFWLENNSPQNVLIVGDNKLVQSNRFSDYFAKLSENLIAN